MGIKVSVIVPIYNTEQYLQKCINSILNQSFKDFEMILVNDGSTDRSVEIIEKYKTESSNIVVINKENAGLGQARNSALEICNGDYIAFVDSDDCIELDMLKLMYSKSLEQDLDILICNYKFVDVNGVRIRDDNVILNDNEIIDNIECIKRFLVTNTIEGFACNKLFKKELFHNYNIRYPKAMKYEDIPTTMSLLSKANRIGFIDKELYNYLLRENSITSTKTIENTKDYINAHLMVGDILENNSIDSLQKEYDYFYSKRVINEVYRFLRTNNNKEENKLFAEDMIKYMKKISKYNICMSNKYYKKIELLKVMIKFYLYYIYLIKLTLKCKIQRLAN